MGRKVKPTASDIENAIGPRKIPGMFAMDERCRDIFINFLRREIVNLGFRIEELGDKPQAVAMLKHWRGQRDYYKHAIKYNKWLIHQLQRKPKFRD